VKTTTDQEHKGCLDEEITQAERRLAELVLSRLSASVRQDYPAASAIAFELGDAVSAPSIVRVLDAEDEALFDADEDDVDWDDDVLADVDTVQRYGRPLVDEDLDGNLVLALPGAGR
jgi:hypothetical protein